MRKNFPYYILIVACLFLLLNACNQQEEGQQVLKNATNKSQTPPPSKRINTADIQKASDCWIGAITPGDEKSNFYDIHFVEDQLGWVVGFTPNTIYKVTDGGVNWKKLEIEEATDLHITGLHFANKQKGWVVGEAGLILHTTNGGQTWTEQSANVGAFLSQVNFANENIGWVVGENGVIIGTKNGGQTWTKQHQAGEALPDGKYGALITSLEVLNENVAWAVGAKFQNTDKSERHILLKTMDSGQTWIQQTAPVFDGTLTDIHFIDERIGFLVGNVGFLAKTIDGGQTWENQSFANVGQAFNRIEFANPTNGFIVGHSGTILKTTNAGQSWKKVELTNEYKQELTDVAIVGNRPIVVGKQGVFLYDRCKK